MASVEHPREEGLKKEYEYYQYLLRSYQSKSLRYAFFAERAASKVHHIKFTLINTVFSFLCLFIRLHY